MRQLILTFTVALLFLLLMSSLAAMQDRVKPASAKGGEKQGEPWAEVPDTFRNMKIPQWPIPTDLKQWQNTDREKTLKTVLQCLGDMPPRPDPGKVKVVKKEDMGDYTLEHFEFHNGADMVVPGILVLPTKAKGPLPVVMGLHGHSGSKNDYRPDPTNPQSLGWMLVKKGFAVAAIDSYFNGDRIGKGPGGKLDKGAGPQEYSLFKLHLWQGRTLWGMMLRDEQCVIDYLQTRPELDKKRIAATGMSMGCTRSWWLAAIDERVHSIVGVACFTRYTELIAHGNLRKHGIYYFVPGIFKHFDTEAIYALVAPRPMLMLSGDQDGGAPTDGILVLEKKLDAVYRLYDKAANFRSVIYENTGHEYLPEMRTEMVVWFEKHLATGK